MRRLLILSALLVSIAGPAYAAGTEYQVTGPVLENSATSITVQKGKDKWELTKDASTKAPADIKAGDKVTIYYTMTAKTIEAKEPAAKDKKKGK